MAYRKIDDSKLTAIADVIRAKLGVSTTMKPAEMPAMIDSIGIGVIPEYWKSYLEAKATEIDTALTAAGENKSAFLWYTDAHWLYNYKQSSMILKYLSKNTKMKKTFFGGDVAQEKTGEISLLTAWQGLVKDIPNHHSMIGNHDNQTTELATATDRADFFIMPERSGDMVMGTDATNGKLYYYMDNHIENTRYICMSTGRMWTYKDEMQWCAEVLNSTPKNWHIVILGHLWLNSDYADDGITLNTTPPDYIQSLLTMFDDYNYRGSGTTAVNSVAYDFANAQAKIEFVIGGHVHKDHDFSTAKGIPVILTECDGQYERDPDSVATKGTTTENCVYAIVVDYTAKMVNVINVGRGHTRSVTIPDVVTYTNWAKKGTESDGVTIFNNGKGYKEDVRINSSGVETAATGWRITGFIPAKKGDIVRFKNCLVYNMSGNTTDRMHFTFYDSAFQKVNESSVYSTTSHPSDAWNPIHGDDGDLIQVTIPASYSSTIVYIRITVDEINENSIITVNETID